MARQVTVNYAEVRSTTSLLRADNSVQITAAYVVGYKSPSGSITYLSHPSFLGAAVGSSVVVISAQTDSHVQSGTEVEAAIAAQEGLNLSAGETVQLILGS